MYSQASEYNSENWFKNKEFAPNYIQVMYVIQFMGMISEKFGAIEKYCVELSFQLNKRGYKSVFVYNEIPPNGHFIKQLESNNASVIELNVNKGIISKAASVFRILNVYKPEIIHCHFNFPLIRLIVFLSWLLRVPKRFVTFHSMPGYAKLKTQAWHNLLLELSSKFFTVSDAIRDYLINTMHINSLKIEVVRLGIDFSEFGNSSDDKKQIRQTLNLPEEKTIIGCVAFHQPIKGIDILLDAVDILKNKHGKDDFVICQVGGFQGNYFDLLKGKVRQLDIENEVLWLGIRDNVPEIMLAFDIYCQPSRSEGLPLAILEAYAAKLPVVATSVGGIPEIVKHNLSGFLVESEDANDLADNLLFLINNRRICEEFGNFGNNLVRKEYDRSVQVSKLIDIYVNKNP